MNKPRKNQEGMALIFAMMAIIVIAGSLALVMTRVQGTKSSTDNAVDMIRLEEAAQAGVDLAVRELWTVYLATSGSATDQNWASYRFYLDNVLGIPNNEDLNFNGVQDANETGDGKSPFQTLPEGADRRGINILDDIRAINDPETGQQLASIESIWVSRYDGLFEAFLTVRATATVSGKSKTAVQVLQVGSKELEHGQFAILANNINCILCHAEIRSLDLERNTDPSLYDSFDRVQVAALESMLVRQGSETDSNIAGTLYTRGDVYKPNGSLYSDNELASSSLRSYQIDSTHGRIVQDGSGNMNLISMHNAGTTAEGDLEQYASLYRQYPIDPNAQTDGPLPDGFPAPFPDENENRYVDDDEFDPIVNTANGSIEFEFGEDDGSGSISAGVAYGVPEGQIYADSELPTASNSARTDLETSGTYDGNLILVGTEDDPIIINRAVAVDGDLVIKGPIKGEGLIHARGNVYVMGDTTYDDAPGEFGAADDGSENAFAVVAGGSIMMGDYLTIRGVNASNQNGSKYPSWSKYSIHARDEHRTGSSNGESLKYGYFDPYSVDAGEEVAGRPGQQFSFAASELQLFNNMELEKALADASYTPRFYGLRESQPDNLYVYHGVNGNGGRVGDEHSVKYSEPGVKTIPEYLFSQGYSQSEVNSIMDRAAMHYLNPKSNWMSEDTLREIWYDDEMSRPSSNRDFMFDGLLYSNNAIFSIARSKGRHKSNMNGKMRIRGGVIAADLGMFIPGGLNLFYDPRVERFLLNKDYDKVAFSRAAFYFEDPIVSAAYEDDGEAL